MYICKTAEINIPDASAKLGHGACATLTLCAGQVDQQMILVELVTRSLRNAQRLFLKPIDFMSFQIYWFDSGISRSYFHGFAGTIHVNFLVCNLNIAKKLQKLDVWPR